MDKQKNKGTQEGN